MNEEYVQHQNGSTQGVLSSNSGTINPGMDDQMEVFGYKRSKVRHFLLWVTIVLSLGIVRLVLHWWEHWRLYVSYLPCSLAEADAVLVVENFQGKFKQYYVEYVETIEGDEADNPDVDMGKENEVEDDETKESGSKQMSSIKTKEEERSVLMRVYLSNNTYRDVRHVRGVWVKRLFYVWDDVSATFIKLSGLNQGLGPEDFHNSHGLSVREQAIRRLVYGVNEIHVPVESIPSMILKEVLNPFYIFQAFSVILWLVDGYIYYPIAIVIMSTFGISSYVIQTRKSQKMLYDTVHAAGTVTVCRGGDSAQVIPFQNLVPGDVIVIPANGCDMHCDVLLLNGQCIVNESMLTGESVPVSKIALPRFHQAVNHTPHTLFCGTKVIQARSQTQEQIKGVVLRTGYLTAKGNLVRSILYPPPADFQFEKDSYKFIWILVVVAMMGLIYTVVAKVQRGIAVGELIVKALDLLTICIPPALPAAMTVGKLFAQKRLEKAQIYCINSRVINVAGALDCLCFDKTGTLTEDGLDFCCGVPVLGNTFGKAEKTPVDSEKCVLLTKAMAVSHSLTNIDGKLSGDPLDTKMFEATGWVFEDSLPDEIVVANPNIQSVVYEPTTLTNVLNRSVKSKGSTALQKIELYHQCTFDSTLQRMSIITKESTSTEYILYAKGSPEMIKSLSKEETVPQDLSLVLEEYTKKGFRVLALARRVLQGSVYADVQKMDRADLEKDLDFLGMIVMENKVKPETAPVITVLRNANIRTMMITGDNMETAVSVARECGIITEEEKVITITAEKHANNADVKILYLPSATTQSTVMGASPDNNAAHFLHTSIDIGYRFAMNGHTWKVLRDNFPNLIPRIVTRGVVFARMSSEQKQQLILELKEIGYCVGMCGDGANDCGALRAADVGISLSDAEASVASPFTSKVDNISCVPLVVRQGRAALTTAFGIFKYMVLYSLMEFASTVILYGIDSNMSDLQFLFIDIFLILQFAITFGRTEAYPGDLVKDPPMTSLLGVIPITSVALQVFLMTGIQLTAYYTIQLYPWFVPFEYSPDSEDLISYENYAVFASSMGQYLIMAFVYSKGAPYRKAIYTNYLFFIPLIVMTVIVTYMAVYPAQWIMDLVEYLLPDTFGFRIVIVALWAVNLAASAFFEEIFIGYFLAKICLPKMRKGKKSPKGYLNVESELMRDSSWPLVVNRQST